MGGMPARLAAGITFGCESIPAGGVCAKSAQANNMVTGAAIEMWMRQIIDPSL
jgi:hypothetical protein